MLVRDQNGVWYEADEEVLKGKQIDPKRREITSEEYKKKQKKVIEFLKNIDNLDTDEKDMLFELYASELIKEIQPPFRWPGHIKSINSNKDLWTNIDVESLEVSPERVACCFKICCVQICCFQFRL